MMKMLCLLLLVQICQLTSGEDFNRTLFAFQTDILKEANIYYQLSHKWFTGRWTKCRPLDQSPNSKCPHSGFRTGIQQRKVVCLNRCQGNIEIMRGADNNSNHTLEDETNFPCRSNNMTTPISSRICHLPCPVDCIFTPFGPWKCLEFARMNTAEDKKEDHKVKSVSKRKMRNVHKRSWKYKMSKNSDHLNSCDISYRVRTILLHPQHGGLQCPRDLIEFQGNKNTMENILPSNNGIRFKVGRWSACDKLSSDDDPVYAFHLGSAFYEKLGKRIRDVSIIQENISGFEDSEKPSTVEFCLLGSISKDDLKTINLDRSFPFDFLDSIFGPWTTYHSSQYGLFEAEASTKSRSSTASSRFDVGYFSNFFDQPLERRAEGHKFGPFPLEEWLTRKVQQLNGDDDDDEVEGDGVEDPEPEKDHAGDGEVEDDCSRYDWLVGRWTECTLKNRGCGVGIQNRSIICVRLSDKVPVQDMNCLHLPPLHTRSCIRPCPSDCLVGQWSPWSQCPVDRCKNKYKEATRTRSRRINGHHPEVSGGTECPCLVQVRSCDLPVCHTWKVVSKGPCIVHTGTVCGANGNMSVTIDCINIQGESVPHKNCPSELRPDQWEICSVPCPNDCIISKWSDWSACDAFDHLYQPITYRTRYKEILATAGRGGDQCINLRLAIDKERCPSPSLNIYQWAAGNWSPCMMRADENKRYDVPDRDPEDSTCLRQGFQRREVYCVDIEGDRVQSKRCPHEHVPVSERSCPLKCRVDCIVTLFSDWQPCPVTCLDEMDLDRRMPPQQVRHRFVLEYPREGGMACPSLIEGRPCVGLPRCFKLAWKVSAWSRCLVADREANCGAGIRKRDVLCVDLVTTEHKPNRFCSTARRFKPHWLELCHVTCINSASDQQCLFSDWSTWSVCSKRCNGIRWRYRTPEGNVQSPDIRYRGNPSCHSKTHSLVESQQCNVQCVKTSVKFIGQWSHCILSEAPPPSDPMNPPLASSYESGIGLMKATNKYCGIGSQYHAIVCSHEEDVVTNDDDDDDNEEEEDDDGVENAEVEDSNYKEKIAEKSILDPSYCSSESIREEMCFSSCKRDCLMSKWSDWKPCETNQRCGNGVMKRSRFILEASLDGGRSCPATEGNQEEQRMPCHITCDQFHWMNGDWSICAPIGQSLGGKFLIGRCGSGLQTRSVRCVRASQFGHPTEEVDAMSCDQRLKPRELFKCNIPCHDECAVSMWSPWSECPGNCTDRPLTSRQRRRIVIRNLFNASCPHLVEQELCSAPSQLRLEPDQSCEAYEVTWSEWSPCMTFNQDACGSGKRVRFAQCKVKSTGKVVAMVFCQNYEMLKEKLMEMNEIMCEVPCIVDCVVSEWLPWSPCSSSCGLGSRTRTRKILIGPQNGGSFCPEVMLQNVSCPFQECFRWMAVGFAECVVDKHSCGHGYQLMIFKCTKYDDDEEEEETDDALCSYHHLPKAPFVRPCYVPCPGECEFSHWSSWSRCHVVCTNQNKPLVKYGFKTRARPILVQSTNHAQAMLCNSSFRVETRTCLAKASTCKSRPIYDWFVGEWTRGGRSVWCQDDQGNQVQGGCDDSRRPSSSKSCDYRCESTRIPHSRCLSDGRCGCVRGFEPEYSDSFALVGCRSEKSSADPLDRGMFFLRSTVEEEGGRRWMVEEGWFQDDLIITRTNEWTYVIASVGLIFMALLCVAIYYVCRRSKDLMDNTVMTLPASETDPFAPRQTFIESHVLMATSPKQSHFCANSPQQNFRSFPLGEKEKVEVEC